MVKVEYDRSLTGLTPDLLQAANVSQVSHTETARYYDNKQNGFLTGTINCGDARVSMPAFLQGSSVATVPSIGGAVSPEYFKFLLQHTGAAFWFVLQHHDGTESGPLHGCGGLHVKEEFVHGRGPLVRDGVYGYVEDRIFSPDAYIMALRQAAEVAKYTDRIVIAGSVDHASGEILPFGYYWNKPGQGEISHLAIPHATLFAPLEEQMRVIYKNGSPPLIEYDSFIDDTRYQRGWIIQTLRQNAEMAAANKQNAAFVEGQKVQNPPLIVMSTAVVPASVRYANLLGNPNSHFGIRIPITKGGENAAGQITISDKARQVAFDQVEYPISQNSDAKPGRPFSDTHTLLIETNDLNLSQELARELIGLDRPWERLWMKRWIANQQNQVWVAQVRSGVTEQIKVYQPEK